MKQEEIDKINSDNMKATKEEYASFVKAFKDERCYMCGETLSSFNPQKLCLHWLLRPFRIKNKHFKDFFKHFNLFQIQSYLMWVAYQENKSANINNLSLEKDKNKVWESTIKYKNLEWSISCAQTELEGHKGTQHDFPHYHFSMKINGNTVMSWQHAPLTQEDILKIKTHNNPSSGLVHFWYIPGMEEVFSIGPKELLKNMQTGEDVSSAPFHSYGMFEMKDGSPLPSEKIEEAFKKSKETKESYIKLISKIPGIKSQIIIEPGEGVPEINRKKPRGQKKNG